METTHNPYDFWLKIEFSRSFLALWDYSWSHNWLMWSCYLPCLACGFSFDDRFWMETTHNPYDFWLKIEFSRSFLALWDYSWSHNWLMWSCYLPCIACGFSFDDRFWMETTHNPYDFWLKNWFFRSFLALWDYFWSHNWLMWNCYLPCVACGFSFDDRFWMETTHNPYNFWLKNWIF